MRAKIPIPALVACLLLASCVGRTPTSPDAAPPQQGTPTPPTTGPPPPSTPPPPAPAPPPPPPTIVRTRLLAFGDSITAGTTSPAMLRAMHAGLPQSYPFKLHGLLAARFTSQTITVYNEGLPLEEASEAVHRLPRVLRETSPEVVILLHGVNDLTGPAAVSRTIGFMNTMARDARFVGADVFICTLLPQRPGGFRAGDAVATANYNAGLRDLARGEGATLIDLDREVELSLIGVDGLHPTEAGNDRMAQILFAALRARFERPPATHLLLEPRRQEGTPR